MTDLERLMSKTSKNNECLEYTGGIGSHGYGVFWMNNKSENAHKASFILNKGKVENGKWVLHTCDNKKCINPLHLYLGDRSQNTKDAIERGRIARGDRHGSRTKPESLKRINARFSDSECIEIKKSSVSKKDLAKRYNVNLCTIYRAAYRADELLNQLENSKP